MEGEGAKDFGVQLDNAMEAAAGVRLETVRAEMELQDQRRRALVSALMSGKWLQVRGTLHRSGVGFCCLGVACEVAIADGLALTASSAVSGVTVYGGESTTRLPFSVQRWYGFDGADPALKVPRRLLDQIGYARVANEWAEDRRWSASALNDDYQLTLPQIGECFQYTFLREDWEVLHGDEAS
jgi:hypothetical protein